jgi:universal stress protein E
MKLLCATDLLPETDSALDRGGFLSDSLGAGLTLLHVVAPGASQERVDDERLGKISASLTERTSPPAWRWKTGPDIVVLPGSPAQRLIETADRQHARLVILGPHRADAFADTVRSTMTEQVLSSATCPVLIARQVVTGGYRHVLIALDGSPGSAHLVRVVEAFALAREGIATVLHAHASPYEGMMNTVGVGAASIARYAATTREQAAENLRELLAAHSVDAHRYRIAVVDGRPASTILHSLQSLQSDLLVLGTRGHGRILRALLGSVAIEVLRDAQCDVLLVPGAALAAASR